MQNSHQTPRTVVRSLTSANAEFNRWLALNHHTQPVDAMGLSWIVTPKLEIHPDPVNLHAARYRLTYEFTSTISRDILVERKVFDVSNDQRLLSMMDDTKVGLIAKSHPFETDTMEKVRAQVAVDLIQFRTRLAQVNHAETFKRLMGRLVDRRFHMAYPLQTPLQIKIDLEL